MRKCNGVPGLGIGVMTGVAERHPEWERFEGCDSAETDDDSGKTS
jgi:hypothetical protein